MPQRPPSLVAGLAPVPALRLTRPVRPRGWPAWPRPARYANRGAVYNIVAAAFEAHISGVVADAADLLHSPTALGNAVNGSSVKPNVNTRKNSA